MSYPYSKYRITNRTYSIERVSSPALTTNTLTSCSENTYSRETLYTLSQNNVSNTRPLNIHINPNLLASSGTVHVNKKKFNINQSAPPRSTTLEPQSNTATCDNKIHYNPKFLVKNQNPPSERTIKTDVKGSPKSKTIYINPLFNKNLQTDNKEVIFESSKSNNKDNSNEIFDLITAPFDHDKFHNSVKCNQTLLSSNENIHLNTNFVNEFDLDPDTVTFNSVTSSKLPTELSSNYISTEPKSPISRAGSSFNSKYSKINTQRVITPKISKISKYKIQRNLIPQKSNQNSKCLSPTKIKSILIPPRKPRLSGSFKKIGKRKLVRKSLIQSYILARRHSVPSMIQHSRNTIASKRKHVKNLSQNKYKFISDTNCNEVTFPETPKYNKSAIPSKSKFKWTQSSSRTQDFVKIGKRKIVRKSILQSILEARRNKFVSYRKYSLNKKLLSPKKKSPINAKTHRSRFKVIRNTSAQSSQQNNANRIRRNSLFNSTKKKESGTVNQFLKSKSILLRMPPSLRFKIRMEEKRERLLLLKKVNNQKKCLFYNRFGHCKGLDSGTCKKLHDPKSISVCQKFLKGMCDGADCKLSHKVVPEKMPTCHQFLAGVCIRPSCPFLHVKLSSTQPICINFLQGFCDEGDSCTKRHSFVCPEWYESGSCKAEKCLYPHPLPNTEKRNNSKALRKQKTIALTKQQPECAPEVTNPPDEINTRYFSLETDNDLGSDLNVNPIISERKPEIKDGVNSVYNNESLLSFIPFS